MCLCFDIVKKLRERKKDKKEVVKIRLKRLGYKKNPSYRIIVIDSREKREGKPIEELGYYNPKTKEMKLNKESAENWVKKGAQVSETVSYLIANCNEDGSLKYKKKETVKLSKKAQEKAKAEAEAKASAEETKAEEQVEAAADEAAAEAADDATEASA